MGQIGVAEAAKRLGVGVHRVHQRIADGSLAAKKVGNQYVINEADLLPLKEAAHRPGRPLSERSVLALLLAVDSDRIQDHNMLRAAIAAADVSLLPTPNDQSRARKRLVDLVSGPSRLASEDNRREWSATLRKALSQRAERYLFHASPRDLDDLRSDNRLRPAGLSAPDAGIASGDIVEAYLERGLLSAIVDDYLLDDVANKQANVVIHAASPALLNLMAAWDRGHLEGAVVDPFRALLLAADLAEHRDPRSEKRAVDLLEQVHSALTSSNGTRP